MLPSALGCTHAPRDHVPPGVTDYSKPYEIILTEYTVPIVLGTALRGRVGGWDEGFSSKRFIQVKWVSCSNKNSIAISIPPSTNGSAVPGGDSSVN